MTIESELQKLAPSALITLFEVDVTPLGGEMTRFHDGVSAMRTPIVWQGEEYFPFPIRAEGFEITGQDKTPRPKLTVANITGLVSALVGEFDDLVGARVTRHRTFARFLDAVNFPGGNSDANSSEELVDLWFIERKISENHDAIEFELTGALDVSDVKIPGRQIIQNLCPWTYRGEGCQYAGEPVADQNDVPTTDPAKDSCGKRYRSCKLRHGEHGELPAGFFIGAGIVR